MFRLGLIGKTLSHSFSKMYFEEKFRRESIPGYSYELFELPDIQQITDFLRRHPDLVGFNVTIPYKQQIIPFLDGLSDEAAEIGAVNAVLIKHIGNQIFAKGFNTDAEGFRQSMNGRKSLLRPHPGNRRRAQADRELHSFRHFPEHKRKARHPLRRNLGRAFPV